MRKHNQQKNHIRSSVGYVFWEQLEGQLDDEIYSDIYWLSYLGYWDEVYHVVMLSIEDVNV